MQVLAAALLLLAPAVPTSTCASCHKEEARSQPATSMGHALELAADCSILRNHSRLTFTSGRYSYTITREGDRSMYRVTDGNATLTIPLNWAFGLGDAGQTYVFEREGIFYESRVSFYKAIDGLDITMGTRPIVPQNLTEAAGREMSHGELVSCVACHTTGAVHNLKLDAGALQPGVQCENCHPGAARHVEALNARDGKNAGMPDLSAMTAEDSFQFCGRCHRTWSEIAEKGPYSIENVRFQPYRLTNSKCYDPSDRRISCVACHNPHNEVVRNTAAYDPKCQACHGSQAKSCPVGKRDCVSCHMPQIELPGAHRTFTDHQIRIVRANEPYPK